MDQYIVDLDMINYQHIQYLIDNQQHKLNLDIFHCFDNHYHVDITVYMIHARSVHYLGNFDLWHTLVDTTH